MIGEEMIDEIDFDGKVIATHPRSYFKERIFLHRASFIMPKVGSKIIVGMRAKEKYPFPDRWSCLVGGKVMHGESDVEAAKREMLEEIGCAFSIEKIGEVLFDLEEFKLLISLFTNNEVIDVNKFELYTSEIQYVKEFSVDDLRTMLDKNPESFTPTFKTLLDKFSEYLENEVNAK